MKVPDGGGGGRIKQSRRIPGGGSRNGIAPSGCPPRPVIQLQGTSRCPTKGGRVREGRQRETGGDVGSFYWLGWGSSSCAPPCYLSSFFFNPRLLISQPCRKRHPRTQEIGCQRERKTQNAHDKRLEHSCCFSNRLSVTTAATPNANARYTLTYTTYLQNEDFLYNLHVVFWSN